MEKYNRDNFVGPLPLATDQEAAAVAKAIGVPEHFETAPLTRVISGRSELTDRSVSPGPAGSSVVMKSPNLTFRESPEISDDDDDEEEEDEDEEDDINGNNNGADHDPDATVRRSKISRQPGKAQGAVVDEMDPSKDPPWLAAILQSDNRKV